MKSQSASMLTVTGMLGINEHVRWDCIVSCRQHRTHIHYIYPVRRKTSQDSRPLKLARQLESAWALGANLDVAMQCVYDTVCVINAEEDWLKFTLMRRQ